MGSCSVGGSFISTDWRRGIGVSFGKDRNTGKRVFRGFFDSGMNVIQDACRERYGENSCYSGSECTVDFRYVGDWSNLSKSEIDKKIKNKLDNMFKWDGEIAKISDEGFIVCKTKIEEVTSVPFDKNAYFKQNHGDASAILVEERDNGYCRYLNRGTVAKLKELAHRELRDKQYSVVCYIISRTKVYQCSFDAQYYKTTKRKTDDKYLVLPLYNYVYYGWASE